MKVVYSERIIPIAKNIETVLEKAVDMFSSMPDIITFYEKFDSLFPDFTDKIKYLKNLPFKPDVKNEQFRSPWIVYKIGGADCDDVAIFTALLCKIHKMKYRYIFQEVDEKTVHVYAEILNYGKVDPYGEDYFKTYFIGKWR